ncbi:uncharacterized protein LOC111377150 isoform X2 [Olea europaea var. sylvestris]|uniref:uncharacterized protein LOC111377150 isoform X2 n=1 Tax=Olea europaea var. sylvestris TaxID=158386 RepID=UPI000C1CEE45|nr:uncharacterized protein LOC111377150 isoform X2 [Olea europaea var. sylvestris]
MAEMNGRPIGINSATSKQKVNKYKHSPSRRPRRNGSRSRSPRRNISLEELSQKLTTHLPEWTPFLWKRRKCLRPSACTLVFERQFKIQPTTQLWRRHQPVFE